MNEDKHGFLLNMENGSNSTNNADKEKVKQKKRKRRLGCLVFIVIYLFFAWTLSLVNKNKEKETFQSDTNKSQVISQVANQTLKKEKNETQNIAKTPPNLGITAEKFFDRFNKAASITGNKVFIEGSLSDIFLKQTENLIIYTYQPNGNFVIEFISYRKDDKLRDVMIHTIPQDAEAIAYMVISWSQAIIAIDPSLNKNQRTNLLKKLGILDTKNFKKGIRKENVVNGIKYKLTIDKSIGTVLEISKNSE